MAAADFLAGVSPEALAQILRTGQVGGEAEALRRRQQRGQALQQQGGQRYSNPWAAALGGLAGVVNTGRGAYEEQQAEQGLAGLGEARTAGREALLGAYTGGMRQQQVTAPDVIAPNIGMPDAAPEQQALAAALRGQQQEEREEGVRRGTAYLGLLSGDEALQGFSKALVGEGAADLREQSLAQGAERLRQQAAVQQRSADLSERRLGVLEKQWAQRQESAEVKAAAKKTADTLQLEEGLRKEVMGNPMTRAYLEAQVAYDKVQRASQDPSAAGDLALIFGVMKTLDPGSTVREGEFANAQNAGGIDDRFVSAYNRVLRGERLSPEQRADFVRTAKGQFAAQQSSFQNLINAFRGVAQRSGARVENVLPLGVSTPAAAPSAAAPPAQAAPPAPTSTEIQEAEAWLRGNPTHPDAPAVRERLEQLRAAGGNL
jgi:hypothetical protein